MFCTWTIPNVGTVYDVWQYVLFICTYVRHDSLTVACRTGDCKVAGLTPSHCTAK